MYFFRPVFMSLCYKIVYMYRMSAIIGSLIYSLLMILCLCLLIWAIFVLLRNIRCPNCAPNRYEHFADAPKKNNISEYLKRSNTIDQLIESVESALESINDNEEDACFTMKYIEDGYIADKSSPPDESEYSLSAAEQQKRADMRKTSAKKRFNTEKTLYASLHNDIPILECFESSSDEELELNEKISILENMLNSKALKQAQDTMDQIQSTLGFNSKYITKLLASLADAKKKKEGFANVLLHGQDLLAKADNVIGKANAFLEQVKRISETTKQQVDVVKTVNKINADVQSGKTLA